MAIYDDIQAPEVQSTDFYQVQQQALSQQPQQAGLPGVGGVLDLTAGGTGGTSAVTARANLGAAALGANPDINTFSALTGSGGWNAWTGGSDKTTHATYSGTASVLYTQAELQAVMDKLQEQTEAFKALVDTLLTSGVIKV